MEEANVKIGFQPFIACLMEKKNHLELMSSIDSALHIDFIIPGTN